MAKFSSLYICCSLIFSIQLLFLSLQTHGAAVDDVCRQTVDPPFCQQCFNIDPRSATAASPMLGEIAVQWAAYYGGNTKIDMHEAMMRAADPAVKNQYSRCIDLYQTALEHFQAAPGELSSKAWAVLRKNAESIRAGVDACEAVFNHNAPAEVANTDRLVGIFADALAIIARSFGG
ncbi:hypothetical protein ABFS82_09G028400 [Erythranthe guttata]|nr:PREDICTED: putative invertase inhibitor [Erythranthe guttata]|eukprot:XP_012831104.1 PREDICTED: putative invertase inhibitor [Erythranthe guttata]